MKKNERYPLIFGDFMSIYACLIFFIAWFVGSFVNGISGLGAAMLALPFISLAVGLDIAVPASCLVSCIVSAFLAWSYRKDCMVKEVVVMAVGCLPGAALGTLALKMLPVRWLCLGLGVLLLLFVVWQIHEQRRTHAPEVRRNPWYGFIAGCCGGFGNAAVSIGGPPLAIYATLQHWDKDAARGTFGGYYMVMSCVTVFFQGIEGLYTDAVLEAAVWGIPGALAGLFASIPCAHAIKQDTFRKILLAIIAGSGLLMLIRGF